jgi:hypothetical protein
LDAAVGCSVRPLKRASGVCPSDVRCSGSVEYTEIPLRTQRYLANSSGGSLPALVGNR